jgi:hypothetical protein
MLRPIRTAAVVAISTLAGVATASAEGLRDYAPPAAAPGTTRGVFFTGYDYLRGVNYEFAGTIVALNGDLGRDGLAFRTYGARMDYELNPGDGRGWQGDVMLGYIFSRSHFSGGIFAGADYQNYKLSPDDPTSVVRGVEWGAKVSGSLTTSKELPYYFDVNAAYTTAFSSYWARARAGLNRRGMTFGPEGIVMGSDGFDAQRLGGFLSFTLDKIHDRPIEVTLSAGHHFLSGSGPVSGTSATEGTYASVTFAVGF